jgi:polyhydroxyalkanoate synthase subunit PhaC
MEQAGQKYINNCAEILFNWQKFYLGLSKYYAYSYKRYLRNTTILWQDGAASLICYDYLEHRPTMLIIPSLINKSYILDLQEHNSLIRYLNQDINVVLLNWDNACGVEKTYNFSDYIINKVLPAIDFLTLKTPKISLLGYCLGGLMAIAANILRADKIAKLALLATPWDFSKMPAIYSQKNLSQTSISFSLIQSWFYQQHFTKVFAKFINFASLKPKSKAAENFVAIEHWLRDGIDVNHQVIEQLSTDFSKNNVALLNKWQLGGQLMLPKNILTPTFIAIPEDDDVVPMASAVILAELLPKKKLLIIPSGHVGMVVGSKAKKHLWWPLKRWILAKNS